MRRTRCQDPQYNDCMNAWRLTILVVWGLTAISTSDAADDRMAAKRACVEVKQKIRKIESRMRAGYTASQGIRLEEKLRMLKDERYRVCR